MTKNAPDVTDVAATPNGGSLQGVVGERNPWPPNMTMRGWMRWQENRWKMHDRQVAWIREQKAHAALSNDKLRHGGE